MSSATVWLVQQWILAPGLHCWASQTVAPHSFFRRSVVPLWFISFFFTLGLGGRCPSALFRQGRIVRVQVVEAIELSLLRSENGAFTQQCQAFGGVFRTWKRERQFVAFFVSPC